MSPLSLVERDVAKVLTPYSLPEPVKASVEQRIGTCSEPGIGKRCVCDALHAITIWPIVCI